MSVKNVYFAPEMNDIELDKAVAENKVNANNHSFESKKNFCGSIPPHYINIVKNEAIRNDLNKLPLCSENCGNSDMPCNDFNAQSYSNNISILTDSQPLLPMNSQKRNDSYTISVPSRKLSVIDEETFECANYSRSVIFSCNDNEDNSILCNNVFLPKQGLKPVLVSQENRVYDQDFDDHYDSDDSLGILPHLLEDFSSSGDLFNTDMPQENLNITVNIPNCAEKVSEQQIIPLQQKVDFLNSPRYIMPSAPTFSKDFESPVNGSANISIYASTPKHEIDYLYVIDDEGNPASESLFYDLEYSKKAFEAEAQLEHVLNKTTGIEFNPENLSPIISRVHTLFADNNKNLEINILNVTCGTEQILLNKTFDFDNLNALSGKDCIIKNLGSNNQTYRNSELSILDIPSNTDLILNKTFDFDDLDALSGKDCRIRNSGSYNQENRNSELTFVNVPSNTCQILNKTFDNLDVKSSEDCGIENSESDNQENRYSELTFVNVPCNTNQILNKTFDNLDVKSSKNCGIKNSESDNQENRNSELTFVNVPCNTSQILNKTFDNLDLGNSDCGIKNPASDNRENRKAELNILNVPCNTEQILNKTFDNPNSLSDDGCAVKSRGLDDNMFNMQDHPLPDYDHFIESITSKELNSATNDYDISEKHKNEDILNVACNIFKKRKSSSFLSKHSQHAKNIPKGVLNTAISYSKVAENNILHDKAKTLNTTYENIKLSCTDKNVKTSQPFKHISKLNESKKKILTGAKNKSNKFTFVSKIDSPTCSTGSRKYDAFDKKNLRKSDGYFPKTNIGNPEFIFNDKTRRNSASGNMYALRTNELMVGGHYKELPVKGAMKNSCTKRNSLTNKESLMDSICCRTITKSSKMCPSLKTKEVETIPKFDAFDKMNFRKSFGYFPKTNIGNPEVICKNKNRRNSVSGDMYALKTNELMVGGHYKELHIKGAMKNSCTKRNSLSSRESLIDSFSSRAIGNNLKSCPSLKTKEMTITPKVESKSRKILNETMKLTPLIPEVGKTVVKKPQNSMTFGYKRNYSKPCETPLSKFKTKMLTSDENRKLKIPTSAKFKTTNKSNEDAAVKSLQTDFKKLPRFSGTVLEEKRPIISRIPEKRILSQKNICVNSSSCVTSSKIGKLQSSLPAPGHKFVSKGASNIPLSRIPSVTQNNRKKNCEEKSSLKIPRMAEGGRRVNCNSNLR